LHPELRMRVLVGHAPPGRCAHAVAPTQHHSEQDDCLLIPSGKPQHERQSEFYLVPEKFTDPQVFESTRGYNLEVVEISFVHNL